MRDPYTLELARRAVAVAENGVTEIAREIGYHRTSLSRYLNEEDFPSPAPIEEALRSRFDLRTCPRTGLEITAEQCRTRALSPRPFGGRAREQHWMFCQTCPNKPQGEQQ